MCDEKTSTHFGCPINVALDVIGGKWKALIVYHLRDEPVRFNQLKRRRPGTTQRMLTKQLRELESDQILHRKICPEIPPKIGIFSYLFWKNSHPTIICSVRLER